jgi:flavin-binding protein dodecin
LGLLGRKESNMAESVYKVIELVGTSTDSWEKAAAAAVEMAAQSLRDLRIAEIVKLDMQLEDGKIRTSSTSAKKTRPRPARTASPWRLPDYNLICE